MARAIESFIDRLMAPIAGLYNPDTGMANAIDVAARREIHHRVRPVLQADRQLLLLLLDLAGDRARTDVRVHLAGERDPDAHRLEVRVLHVGRDDETTTCNLAANELGLVFYDDAFAACDAYSHELAGTSNRLSGCVGWTPRTDEVVEKLAGRAKATV